MQTQRSVHTLIPHSPVPLFKCNRRFPFRLLALAAVCCLLALVAGCNRFHHEQHDTVYVSARQVYLHDRVAAVSERVALVVNGQSLEVLERGRRFLKVQTEKNEVGWIEERAVIDSKTYDGFVKLAADHKQDPVASTATLRDDLYMHLTPGRDTDHLYLLAGNAKVALLARASAPRVAVTGATPVAHPAVQAAHPTAPSTGTPAAKPAAPAAKSPVANTAQPTAPNPAEPPPPPPMEDWWLARDSQGRIGWLLANRLDVDVPDEIAEYGEGQRFVGSWLLTKVNDPDADTPDHMKPEYLTVTSPTASGLAFDFDQLRVFTWSLKHHRYETAFRLHPIQGYLPVRVSTQSTPNGSVPVFSFEIAGGQAVATDPTTGITRPLSLRTINYELLDTSVKRIGPDLAPLPMQHDEESAKKSKEAKAAKKKRK